MTMLTAKCGNPDCRAEVQEEASHQPRAPCPRCGWLAREFSRGLVEYSPASDDSASTQTRSGVGSVAELRDGNEIKLSLDGRAPKNEEGALEACIRVVEYVN